VATTAAAHAATEPPPMGTPSPARAGALVPVAESSLIPVELLAPSPPLAAKGSAYEPMPSIDVGVLVGIDEVPKDGDTVRSPAPAHMGPPAVGVADTHAAFAATAPIPAIPAVATPVPAPSPVKSPPPEVHAPLEIEKEWGQEKAAKAANPFPEHAPHKRGGGGGPGKGSSVAPVIVGAVGLVAILVGGVLYQHHRRMAALDSPVTTPQPGLGSAPSSITIRVTGTADRVTIDGKPAGKPPLSMMFRRDGHTLRVEGVFGDHTSTQQIVADHDQTVELRDPVTGR
jgi:hypothetical protein